MTLTEYADIISKEVVITYRPNRSEAKYIANFSGGEVKEGWGLVSVYGNGTTPEEAMQNYLKGIAGKKLVFNARRLDRAEYMVPVGAGETTPT